MKRLAFVIISCLMFVVSQAQTEHMKFMGIPLNGTITQFQAKLIAKGFKFDAQLNKTIIAGCRAFKGVFSEDNADIYVYFNTKTKVVYRAKAVIECMNIKKGEEKLELYKSLLKKKYPNGYVSEQEHNNHPSLTIYLDKKNGEMLGVIDLYITDSEYSFVDKVWLHIDYADSSNYDSNEKKKMEDL